MNKIRTLIIHVKTLLGSITLRACDSFLIMLLLSFTNRYDTLPGTYRKSILLQHQFRTNIPTNKHRQRDTTIGATEQRHLQAESEMSHTADKASRAPDGVHEAQYTQELSDTDTIDHDFMVRPGPTSEVSDTETIDYDTADLKKAHSSRQNVFATTELLEHIISFLPMKKIFNVQRVSKRWQDVISTSPSIQEKMFLRPKTTPKEVYGARRLGQDVHWLMFGSSMARDIVTMVTLNPELRYDEFCRMRRFGVTCLTHGKSVVLRWGPAPIRQCLSLMDTYISDPPCKAAEVCLTVRFKTPADEFGRPQAKPEYPMKIWMDGIIARSESGLTFQDVLRAALYARGQAECKDDFRFPSAFTGMAGASPYKTFSWDSGDQLRDVIELLPKYTGIHEILDSPTTELKLTLLDNIAAPTPEEWASLRQESTPR